jgi:glycosyltransferase involved in cell wall biosynthesis
MKKLKLLSISHSCVVGEYQTRMEEVANYSDVDLTLLVPKYWFQFNKKVNLEKNGDFRYRILSVQPIIWGWKKNSLQNATHTYLGIRKILKSLEPDIIELWEEPFSVVTAHTIFWTKRIVPKAKIIFFSAQNVFKRHPLPFWAFEKYTYEKAHFAFLMNKEVIGVVRRKGYEKEFAVLPLGVDTDMFRKKEVSSLKKRLGIENFVVGFVGKLTKQKGIVGLIEAVSRISEKVQLLIIGKGDMRGEVENLVASLGLGESTVIIDAVRHGEVPDYLNCMDLLVLPSITLPHLKEQFGRVIIEGMACQVPVIGSDSGEIPVTIGKAGLIFKEGDVRDLKEKIEALIKNPNLRDMLAKNGRKRVLDKFSWKVIAKKQHQVYTELMSRGK